jgi:hypothetical protein
MATTYVDELKALSPEAYAKIAELAKFTANENYGGKVQDYQAQIFTPLSADIINSNKTIDVTKGIPKDAVPTYVTVQVGAGSEGEVITEDRPSGFSKSIGVVNGVPVTASYDMAGNLTGFVGDQKVRSFIDGRNSVAGNWDASGSPAPKQYSSSGGGFLGGFVNDIMSDPILGTAANIAAGYFGGPLGTAALGVAQGKSPEEIAKSAALSYVAGEAFKGLSADPNAVGGVTGPDNIDVGGGFNPAAGATAAELEAARAALNNVVSTPIPDANIVATELPALSDSAVDQVISNLANEQQTYNFYQDTPYQAMGPFPDNAIANAADNIDVGGGFNPATGTGDAATAAAAAANPPVLSVDAVINNIANAADNIDVGGGYNPATGTGDVATANAAAGNPPVLSNVDTVISNITGNADRAALNSNAGYGDTLTSAQITAFDAAVASGMSVADALNYARAGLLVNAITGDPLGLAGDTGGGGGGGGTTGFAQVPIPAEWRSPTYAAPSAPIDLNSFFTDMNLLGGTQWQGLVGQKPNVSFNDIFAAGKQQTPMGTPVNINQIVSAILGQDTASQKST